VSTERICIFSLMVLYIYLIFLLHSLLYLVASWAWWDWPLTQLTNHCPSVLWHCWLGHLTWKIVRWAISIGKLLWIVHAGFLQAECSSKCQTVQSTEGVIQSCLCVNSGIQVVTHFPKVYWGPTLRCDWSSDNKITGCLQLLDILKIYWNLKSLLEILEISWNLIVPPGNFYITDRWLFSCGPVIGKLASIRNKLINY